MRYNFSLLKRHTWKDLFTNPRYLFGMWGLRLTLTYVLLDTFQELHLRLKALAKRVAKLEKRHAS